MEGEKGKQIKEKGPGMGGGLTGSSEEINCCRGGIQENRKGEFSKRKGPGQTAKSERVLII